MRQLRDLRRRDLDARNVAMRSDADLRKPECGKRAFCPGDALESFGRDARMVGDAARQARGRWLVPGGKAKRPRQIADVLLAIARLEQRASHAELDKRAAPGAVVGIVVDVAAVGHTRDTVLEGNRADPREDRLLAQVTALGRVVRDSGDREDICRRDDMGDTFPRCPGARLLQIVIGHERALDGNSEHVVTQHVVRDLGEKRRVDPSRKRDCHAPELQERRLKLVILDCQFRLQRESVRHGWRPFGRVVVRADDYMRPRTNVPCGYTVVCYEQEGYRKIPMRSNAGTGCSVSRMRSGTRRGLTRSSSSRSSALM